MNHYNIIQAPVMLNLVITHLFLLPGATEQEKTLPFNGIPRTLC